MAKLKAWLAAPFAFTSIPVTMLTVLLYLVVIISVLYTDQLPEVPKDTRGLDIERAYRELHEVSYSHVEPNTCSFFWMTVKHSDVVLYCIDSVISECD